MTDAESYARGHGEDTGIAETTPSSQENERRSSVSQDEDYLDEIMEILPQSRSHLYNTPEKPKNECNVCWESMASADMLAPAKLTSTCVHYDTRQSCFPCVAAHIGHIIDRFALNAINCPHCDESFSLEEIKKYAIPEVCAR